MLEAQRHGLSDAIRTLSPTYFALVMATGTVSVGIAQVGSPARSLTLLWIAVAAYVVLVVFTVWRLIAYRHEIVADFTRVRTGFAFFTFVAATDVIAARFIPMLGFGLPCVLLVIAFSAWLVLEYAIPGGVVLSHPWHLDALRDVNGTWFIWPVASQSVALVAASIEPLAARSAELLAIIAVLSWSIGVVLYGVIGVVMVVRMLTQGIAAAEIGPDYWVAMGAAAITVLAASKLVEMTDMPMIDASRGFVAGAAVVLWSFATWLIPALVGIGWWRHVVHRVPVRYESALWGMVFPMSMYAVASMYLGKADRLPTLGGIGEVSIWVAFGVWAIVAVSMLVHVVRRLWPA
ncbi:tellurite resistance/C4-dicarboxylate transporter family protein [Humibacter antri]